MKNLHFGCGTVKGRRFFGSFGSELTWDILGSRCTMNFVARADFFDRWGCMRNHTSFDRLAMMSASIPIELGRNRGTVAVQRMSGSFPVDMYHQVR